MPDDPSLTFAESLEEESFVFTKKKDEEEIRIKHAYPINTGWTILVSI